MKNIYLSAPGLICCAGRNRDELYESCLNGDRSGIIMRELPDGKTSPTGQISWDIPDTACPLPVDEPLVYTDGTRMIRIINEALEQIRPGIEKAIAAYGPEKIGVCTGSTDNGSEACLLAHKEFAANGFFPKDYNLRFQSAAFPAEFISRKFGLQGPALTIATACASGSSAIAKGAELIRSGYCDVVIAGGADIVSDTAFLGFHTLEALSDNFTNPFSKNRKGINLGEGACFFLLDSENMFGDAGIELLGFGESTDAYHMTAPGPDGAGPVKAMQSALRAAGIAPEKVDYVNLHGTGTELNDKAEALAMKTVFCQTSPSASSTKPITGHTMAAAGALEAAVCWMVLTEKRGFPVHCWDGESEEEIPFFSIVQNRDPTICMNNNFAFGGYNISLILGKRK